MKFYLALLLSPIAIISNAQKQNTYNTKIGQANQVTVSNSQISINKADSVFILTHTDITPVYLKSVDTKFDSIGWYTTTYKFIPKQVFVKYDINITMRFKEPFFIYDTLNFFNYTLYDNGNGSAIENISVDSIKHQIQVSSTVYAKEFAIILKSRTPLHGEISGIAGKLD